MTVACTYREAWERYEELREYYLSLMREAKEDGSTLAQYAGSEKLDALKEDIELLLVDSEGLIYPTDRARIQSAICKLLNAVNLAYFDARLFECGPAADFEDYSSSRPCPLPKVLK